MKNNKTNSQKIESVMETIESINDKLDFLQSDYAYNVQCLREKNEENYANYKLLCESNAKELETIKRQKEEIQFHLNELLNSKSMKLTAPLRAVKHALLPKKVNDSTDNSVTFYPSIKNNEDNYLEHKDDKMHILQESKISRKPSVEMLRRKISKYDVVSFDVFDTLLYRIVSDPTHVFDIVGLKIGNINFKRLRIQAEEEARKNTKKDNSEINIFDIYNILEKYMDIDKEKTIRTEFETELECLRKNEYIFSLFNSLKDNHIIIYTSDMYWPKEYIEIFLDNCGYPKFDNGFVSCDFHCGKNGGKIQKMIGSAYPKMSIVHIGDNKIADVDMSIASGWEAIHYNNINEIGNNYRPKTNNTLSSSIYNSIVNHKLHSTDKVFSANYEYGYKYGGIIVSGFCEWLNNWQKEEQFDKVLFLGRDLYIFHDIYNKYYRTISNDYAEISRFSIMIPLFEDRTEEFIQFYIKSRIPFQYSFEEVLTCLNMDFLIPNLEKNHLLADEVLDASTYDGFREFIYNNKNVIVKRFKKYKDGAIAYFKNKIGKSKKICVCDLGWNATIFIYLREFINKYVNKNCCVYGGYVAICNTDKVNLLIESGALKTYLFSGLENEDLRINSCTYAGENQLQALESMFSSPDRTVLYYILDNNKKIKIVYGESTAYLKGFEQCHNGINDYVADYIEASKHYNDWLKISARDAFSPFKTIEGDYMYTYYIWGKTKENFIPIGDAKSNKMTNLANIMIKKGLIDRNEIL